ncbi:unnamed protein product [Microthlaspi erraticum]|uniref:Uncharacterized protein n=1 Tax=Microthlaspi erraticum TaxID=1685480 RepID=A0A6D2KDH9_9BRAS|nr:unnamed protein product [Microthlaspi erraticum]
MPSTHLTTLVLSSLPFYYVETVTSVALFLEFWGLRRATQARGCGARGRGARGRGGRARGRGGRGRDCGLPADSRESVAPSVATASVTQPVSVASELLTRFSPVVSHGAPGLPPVAEVQQRAAGFVQPQAVGLMVPPYLDMMGHMQRIGTPYF